MREDELRATLARADRPRAMTSEEHVAVLNRILDGQPSRTDASNTGRSANGRGAFWLTTAAALLVSLAFGLVFLNRTDADQAALLPGSTTVPCTLVGQELADAIDQWGSIDDWAVAASNPEPDLALLTVEALRAAHPDSDASETLQQMDDMLRNPRRSGAVEAMERAEAVERAISELAQLVEDDDDSCLAPGLGSLG